MILECPARILREIAGLGRENMDALRMGVLFGEFENGVVRVESWREAKARVEHVIPEADDAVLRRVIAATPDSQAVGFFVRRGGEEGETRLSEADVEVFEQVFPERWQVALAMREEAGGSKARFFAHCG
ncbi:MAG TPA: hypothetical protein VG672_21650 [Bryobacteraceae bacterium]|nr:hypothetical protein [Bryobacteraceae bacterium]